MWSLLLLSSATDEKNEVQEGQLLVHGHTVRKRQKEGANKGLLEWCMCILGHVQLLVMPWTIACQDPLSMGFPRQEYWNVLPCPPPGDLPNSGIETESPMVLALAGGPF